MTYNHCHFLLHTNIRPTHTASLTFTITVQVKNTQRVHLKTKLQKPGSASILEASHRITHLRIACSLHELQVNAASTTTTATVLPKQ
jgi:hypothetical protein